MSKIRAKIWQLTFDAAILWQTLPHLPLMNLLTTQITQKIH